MTMTGTAKAILGDLSTAASNRLTPGRRAARRRRLEEVEDREAEAFFAAMRGTENSTHDPIHHSAVAQCRICSRIKLASS